MVTGGFAPNIEGWASPSRARCCNEARRAATANRHRRRARRGRQDRAADPAHRALRLPPAVRGAPRIQSPIRSTLHAARSRRAASNARSAPSCAAPAGARGRLRRRRGDGQRGLSHQPVPRPPHQPAQRRVGRQLREPHAPAGGDRAARARGGRAGLHHHLPPVDARPGPRRQQLGRSGDAREGDPKAGATIINTGIGWHEARIPTIATSVPRGAFAWVTGRCASAAAEGHHRRWSPATASTCPRWPSRSSPTAAPTWCRWRARCWPTRLRAQGARGTTTPTRSTPASPATRPAWTTPSSSRSRAAWSTRAGHETELVMQRARREAHTPWSAPARGLAFATTLAERGHEVICSMRRPHRRPVQHGQAHPGKEEFNETLRYFDVRLAGPARLRLGHARRCGDAWRRRSSTPHAGHRREPARPEDPRRGRHPRC